MRWKSDEIVATTVLVSRRVIWSFFGLFFLAGIIGLFGEAYGPKWLAIIVAIIGGTSILLLVISWGMPGIFVLLGAPWLAQAWFQGQKLLGYPLKPWEQISTLGKVVTYLHAVVSFTLLIIVIVVVVQCNLEHFGP